MFIKRKQYKFGERILKLGAKGQDVGQLQKKLQQLGYKPGPKDEDFGYLTQEALEFFQRDYGLQIDGIAGKQSYALLNQKKLPVTRRVHVVKPGETLTEIATKYSVGTEAFRIRQNRLYPGQELIFFDREVWGTLTLNLAGIQRLAQAEKYLTGVFVSVPIGDTSKHKRLNETNVSQIAKLTLPNGSLDNSLLEMELAAVHNLLTKRRRKKGFLQFLNQLLTQVEGFYIPWEHIPRGDGSRYCRLIRQVKKIMGDKRLLITLTPAMPRWNLLGGIDFVMASNLADRIVIKTQSSNGVLGPFNKDEQEMLIHKMLGYVPAYKILLSVPVYAVMWNNSVPNPDYIRLSHGEALTKAFVHGGRLEIDPDGRRVYTFVQKKEEWKLVIRSMDQFDKIMPLVNRYNLAGLVIDDLGEEDKRLWQVVQSHFSIEKFL